jgi:isoleucyl-tRNA synthetase
MLRWMAPFLSFTAEEAWKVFGTSESIFFEEYAEIGSPDTALLGRWNRIREIRDAANKEIEALREKGQVGSSLQANLVITAAAEDHALLAALGEDLKFVFIASAVRLQPGEALAIQALPSGDTKCDRCWHWRSDVGADAAHPTICGRCVSNLFGAGEARVHA